MKSEATQRVRPEQRFTRSHPCTVCGGYDSMSRGEGMRCYGFLSDDGEWAHCTRPEYAGKISMNQKSKAFPHRLTGECICGVHHDGKIPATLTPSEKPTSTVKRGRIVAEYDYQDELGKLVYQAVRKEPKGFFQRRPDEKGGWLNNLHGVDRVPYGLPELQRASPDETVLVLEGEKDVHEARSMGFVATTNAGGAGKWGAAESEHLRGGRVVIIGDNDPAGRKHTDKAARSLYGVAASVKVLQLPNVPESGDLTDFADAGGTAEDLQRLIDEAPEWTPPEESDEGRVLLGRAITDGIEPPVVLVDDLILEGKAHSIYGPPGLGKTFVMLWIILKAIECGLNVVLYDAENGPRLMAERLMQMGADPVLVDRHLFYFPYPSLPTTEEGRLAYEALLDRVRPALVCFDSWISFLATNGLDENSSNDIATFAAAYIAPARSRDEGVLLLDHVPHEAKHARGSTRKKDELDVVWSLRSVKPFDRETIGQVELQREKDREGWLRHSVAFTVGGDGDGNLVFERSEATPEPDDDGLKDSERDTLQALETYCKTGAKASEWRNAAEKLEVKERSFWNAVKSLKEKGYVLQEKDVYFPATVIDCKSTAMQQSAVDPNATALHCTPLIGVQACSTGADEEGGENR